MYLEHLLARVSPGRDAQRTRALRARRRPGHRFVTRAMGRERRRWSSLQDQLLGTGAGHLAAPCTSSVDERPSGRGCCPQPTLDLDAAHLRRRPGEPLRFVPPLRAGLHPPPDRSAAGRRSGPLQSAGRRTQPNAALRPGPPGGGAQSNRAGTSVWLTPLRWAKTVARPAGPPSLCPCTRRAPRCAVRTCRHSGGSRTGSWPTADHRRRGHRGIRRAARSRWSRKQRA